MKEKKKVHTSVFGWIGFAIICLYIFTLFFVLGWALITSLKTAQEFGTVSNGNIMGFPKKVTFENYIEAFTSFRIRLNVAGEVYAYIEDMFLNSCLYVFGCSFVTVASRLLVAYAVAKFDFVGKRAIYMIVIVTMIIPIIGSLPSEVKIVHALGLYDTLIGAYIMKAGFTGMNFLIFYAAFRSISNTYMEAAEIDGAGHFRVLFSIMIPLVKTVIMAIFITTFISFWNEYYTQMMYLPSMPGFAYGLYRFTSSNTGNIPGYMAIALMISVPIIIIFICFRNMIMGNITIGGIKG